MAGIDLNPDEIQFIVQPYQFEPHRGPEQPLSSSESSSESDSERDSDIDDVATDEWCTCNNCVAMPTATERRCCQSFAVCQPKLDEATITCITMHEAFQVNCLNHHVLELSFYEYLDYNGPIGDEEPVHELYRYIAYRRYTRWLWHRLGKKTRKVIPSCVVSAIRTRFPSDEYTGFRYPRDY
ncbi:P2X purinoceptor 7-like [Crassostrea angulata]|nr:P2X purinoceptor 7-like [Crassostrea angulata]